MDTYLIDPVGPGVSTAVVEGDEAHHLLRVARHAAGDVVLLTDGAGMSYRVRVRDVRRDSAVCDIEEQLPGWNEPAVHVTVAFALLRNPGRMDWLIEKSVELGASALLPIVTERTIPRSAKTARWRQLAVAATKQSGRSLVPVVHDCIPFGGITDLRAGHSVFVCHELAQDAPGPDALRRAVGAEVPVMLVVGPEGGFTDAEITHLVASGAQLCSLGVRRLRAETAAIAALARLVD